MTKSLQKLNLTLPIGSLEAYIARVNHIPILTEEEESQLANRFYQHNDIDAARKLVLSHLRFVVRVARGYLGYGLALGDLIQEGSVGLMKAVKRFNPDMGVRLVSFAVHWIKAEIHEFILKNWRIVKVATTKAQRKLFFNLRKASKQLVWLNNEEVHQVADQLSVSAEDVRLMEKRLNAHDEAFDALETNDTSNNTEALAPADYLEDYRYSPERQLTETDWFETQQHRLHYALDLLDERSRDILRQRWLSEEKATLHDLAAKYQVSAERIRQIEKMALDKLRSELED